MEETGNKASSYICWPMILPSFKVALRLLLVAAEVRKVLNYPELGWRKSQGPPSSLCGVSVCLFVSLKCLSADLEV